jgi:hypothetical protein
MLPIIFYIRQGHIQKYFLVGVQNMYIVILFNLDFNF